MSKYKGLFTFDVDNHRYVSVEQADGIISDMNYNPEPNKPYYSLNLVGEVDKIIPLEYEDTEYGKKMEELGNHFATEEEAEKTVEKLKAWKRLKDAGFKFKRYGGIWGDTNDGACGCDGKIDFSILGKFNPEDLNLLFGGEE